MPLSTVAGLRRPMPQLRLYDAYGLSETHSPATILLDAEFERKPGSIGRPVPCCDVHIVDPDGSDLPTGEAGELLVRGPNITSGYVGDPAATATAIRNGWLHTGDYCRVDAEGFVYLLTASKTSCSGAATRSTPLSSSIYASRTPESSRRRSSAYPKIAYEAVACYITATAGETVTAVVVRTFVHERMADYAVPRHVRIVDETPRNKTGKIEKDLLRGLLTAELQAQQH